MISISGQTKDRSIILQRNSGKQHRGSSKAPYENPFNKGILSVLRYPNFSIFVAGASINTVGNWIQTGALTWYVNENTHSSALVGTTNLISCLPIILLVLFAGALADRISNKKLILLNQSVMLLAALALAISTSFGWPTIGVILAIVLVNGFAAALNAPAWQAVIPEILPSKLVLDGTTLQNLFNRISRFLGLFLGGLVLSAWSPSAAFYLNAASYIFVIFSVSMIRTVMNPINRSSKSATTSLASQVANGWRYIRRNKWAAVSIFILGFACLFGSSTTVLLPSLTTEVLKKSAAEYSWLWSAAALGSFLGVAALAFLSRRYRAKELLKISSALFGPLLIAVSFSRSFPLSVVLMAGLGGSFLMLNSVVVGVLNTHSDSDKRGTVLGFYVLAQTLGFALGGQLVGLLADIISTPWTFLICGSICTLQAMVFILFPGLSVDHLSFKATNNRNDAADSC